MIKNIINVGVRLYFKFNRDMMNVLQGHLYSINQGGGSDFTRGMEDGLALAMDAITMPGTLTTREVMIAVIESDKPARAYINITKSRLMQSVEMLKRLA